MKRTAVVITIQLAAGVVSIVNVLHFRLTNLLEPSQEAIDFAVLAALGGSWC